MSIPPPKIDKRTYKDIVDQTKTLVEEYTNWRSPTEGKADAGLALIRIFGRMAALVSDRLNKVPDKNFLAFLNLIGAQLKPPQPARVPLTFYLAEGTSVDALVPANTQVSATPVEGETEEVVFETDRELIVTPVQLQAVFVREPDQDKYSDRTKEATGQKDEPFPAFEGDRTIEHYLYISCNEIFSLTNLKEKNVTLTIHINPSDKLQYDLSYWDGIQWQNIIIPENNRTTSNKNQVKFEFKENFPSSLMPYEINGRKEKWLRTGLKRKNSTNKGFPQVENINVRISVNQKLTPEVCLFNATPIDLSKDFYPFGETPRHNDTFYIALHDESIQPETKVTISATLIHQPTNISNPEITWEMGDGKHWKTLSKQQADSNSRVRWSDNSSPIKFIYTENSSTFEFPQNLPSPSTINEENHYWIRARITNGYYGTPAGERKYSFFNDLTLVTEEIKTNTKAISVASVDELKMNDTIRLQDTQGKQEEFSILKLNNTKLELNKNTCNAYPVGTRLLRKDVISEIIPETFEPPVIKSLTLTYNFTLEKPALYCAYNDFTYFDSNSFETTLNKAAKKKDTVIFLNDVGHLAVGEFLKIGDNSNKEYQIEFVDSDNKQITLTEGLEHPCKQNSQVIRLFKPLTPTLHKNPTFYLGFNKPFANRTITLYIQVEPPQSDQVAADTNKSEKTENPTEPAKIVWEYASSTGWKSLGVRDETLNLTQPGLIQFIGPTDFIQCREFGKDLYWLRVRLEKGSFRVMPRLRRILTNTTWASQAVTLHNEVLGSSTGDPKQVFYASQTPILLGQQLEVQEGRMPSPVEQQVIEPQAGTQEDWVLWQEVPNFYGSDRSDRHYILERETGKIEFGDGQAGMIPPQGRNNIRLSRYQSGGGKQGNVQAKKITQLKTTIPYIDHVVNLEAAVGGTEQESLEHLKEQGSKKLRHGDRAVTLEDFEDLAVEASVDVARVKVIPPELMELDKQKFWNPLEKSLWLNSKEASLKQEHDKVKAGQIGLIVVPYSRDRQPTPSVALLNKVEAYIKARCSPGVELMVSGPKWKEVKVTAEIVPISLEGADALVAEVRTRLEHFLHPLTGEAEGQGWSFGRYPHKSDLYALLERVEGVDHVETLEVKGVDHVETLEIEPKDENIDAFTLIYSGEHDVRLKSPGGNN